MSNQNQSINAHLLFKEMPTSYSKLSHIQRNAHLIFSWCEESPIVASSSRGHVMVNVRVPPVSNKPCHIQKGQELVKLAHTRLTELSMTFKTFVYTVKVHLHTGGQILTTVLTWWTGPPVWCSWCAHLLLEVLHQWRHRGPWVLVLVVIAVFVVYKSHHNTRRGTSYLAK